MRLHDIGLKYGTDKATFHCYMDIYEKYFQRDSITRFLEIGILNGSSLRVWREWFPQSVVVEGWDIRPYPAIDGCEIKVVDQRIREQMKLNVGTNYDIILDDGAHTAKSIQTSFSFLFPYTKMYVIEDLHAPWIKKRYLGKKDFNTLEVLKNFDTNGWKSKHSTKKETDYINKNAKVIEIFLRLEGEQLVSAMCIIENKSLS